MDKPDVLVVQWLWDHWISCAWCDLYELWNCVLRWIYTLHKPYSILWRKCRLLYDLIIVWNHCSGQNIKNWI